MRCTGYWLVGGCLYALFADGRDYRLRLMAEWGDGLKPSLVELDVSDLSGLTYAEAKRKLQLAGHKQVRV